MTSDQILDELERVAKQLEAELKVLPQYQMLSDVQSLIARRRTYLGLENTESEHPRENAVEKRSTPVRDGSVAASVQEAAALFLKSIGRRAQTREIVEELMRRDIRPGKSENMIATVSSYLSTAKDRFDNVRGKGYGLVEWLNQSIPVGEMQPGPSETPSSPEISETEKGEKLRPPPGGYGFFYPQGETSPNAKPDFPNERSD